MSLDRPTQAEPGSPEKLRILTLRWAKGETLFHPQDRRIEHAHYNQKTDIVSFNSLLEAIVERRCQWRDAD